ncbi:putative manganese efflux pump MntP [termite gut metagenome]|uniref:Putative manganese efflux pump MntP n=1 Tax=termite gut metagenome TaxID=433724 RepID=A0A5J4T496_9ZZZZ
MSTAEVWLIAIGLAMDCLAVSVASGLIMKKFLWRQIFTIAFSFGFSQGMMLLIGCYGAGTFSHLMQDIDHWIAFLILAFLGGRMVWESFKEEKQKKLNLTSLKVIFTMTIATSIDALAVGISFAFLEIKDIFYPVFVVGFVSFVLSLFGLFFGICCKHGGHKMHVEVWGGLILIAIGIKIVIEHLFF